MFLGIYRTYFSGKLRILLPKKFRKELDSEDKVFLILGTDGEIWGFNSTTWQKEAEKILEMPLTTIQGRIQRRNFFSRADECILDSQGRFILPSEFVEQTNIQTQVVLVGAGDHFEIWDPGKWEETRKKLG